MPKQTAFMCYSDPGHGWIRVPRTMLTKLGIAEKITRFSYAKGKYVYLEEDLDATTFIKAYASANNNTKPPLKEKFSNSYSSIRDYPSYRVEA